MVFGLPLSFSQPARQTSAARRLGLHDHVRDHLLHELERGDRAVELRALLGVRHRRVQRGLADPHAAGRHAVAAGVERGHGDLEAVADLAHERAVGHLHAVERELGGVGALEAELAVDLL